MWDDLIVGGGPAGLSAALLLGRCRRHVLLCDGGHPRNERAGALHGFLSRDGTPPSELLQIGREQLQQYETIDYRPIEVTECRRGTDCFESALADGSKIESRLLLLATGVRDELPDIEGIESCYGKSVHHCPYCDGWEWRDQPLAVYGKGKSGAESAITLSLWSADVVLCTDGPASLSRQERKRLQSRNIAIREDRVLSLEASHGMLQRIVFAHGEPLPRKAMFTSTHQVQGSSLPEALGCEDESRRSVPPAAMKSPACLCLFVAGDASRDVQLAIVAAAEGAQAAFTMNKALLALDIGTRLGK